MSLLKINLALQAAFLAGDAFFAAAKVQRENVAFDPPGESAWAKLFFLPASNTVATLGSQGQDRVDGIFQIELNYPLNKGTKDVSEKADAIVALFVAGKAFSNAGQEVKVISCYVSPGRAMKDFYVKYVDVRFYAFVSRPAI